MKEIALLLILMIPCAVACAQKANTRPSGWDLSYSSVLDANGVGQDEWIRRWLGPQYQSRAGTWISNWTQGPIKSSVLLEFPAHAGERIIMWLVRTDNQAFRYERAEGSLLNKDDKPPHENNESLDTQAYDNFFNTISKWEQAKPLKPEDNPVGAIPGYSGFLSVYDSGNSRQMLLTPEDFAICDTKQCETWKPGRLTVALKLIPRFNPESQYQHKSETEIAAMTPAQLVDEYANEQTHAYKTRDDHRYLINKYLWRDGPKAMPRMVEIMNQYDSTNPTDRDKKGQRFNAMLMLMNDLDNRVVRLRGTVEGRQVMDALERALARIRAAANGKTGQHEWAEYGRFEGAKADLEAAKGINLTDEAIQDTLWVKYKIKVSDKELLAFTNYLIARDPTYPSWSEMEGDIEDYSRLNKEGYPARVNIMKEPDRFYQAYLAFKKKTP